VLTRTERGVPNASEDSPDWIAENADASNWTANIDGLDGNLAITVDQTGAATYQYSDLHGDNLATAHTTDSAPTLAADYDEFGNPTSGTAPSRYGWLGGKQRSTDDLGGLILMGERLYNPTLGRFLQTDPVPGGSANDYDYCSQDPINCTDLNGQWGWHSFWHHVKHAASWGWHHKGFIAMQATWFIPGLEEFAAEDDIAEGLTLAADEVHVPMERPGPDWTWKGRGEEGSERGNWTRGEERIRPHLSPSKHGPHWDYGRGSRGFRLFPGGRWEVK
jgi:RHS repeat-associated protein